MKTLIGMVTFGNLPFSQLTVRSIEETVKSPYELFVVAGKPSDNATKAWLKATSIPHIVHDRNYGLPYSINDIYDYAWKENDFDAIVIIGNDVIAYPYAIDSLITIAETTDNEWVCSREYDARALCRDVPEAREYFHGDKLKFKDFDKRPWELNMRVSPEIAIGEAGLSDVHNLALFKKGVFDRIGYIDVNFYPAYYEDNDYVRRAINAETPSCTVNNAVYFHFWSRTIHQETGGSTHRYFQMNRNFYILKWGGDFGKERFTLPFDGNPYNFGGIELPPALKLDSRDDELAIIKQWRSKGV